MSFIYYGNSRIKASYIIEGINKNKIFKRICLIGFVLFLGLPLIYMALAIVFKWDTLFQFIHSLKSDYPASMWIDGKVSFQWWGLGTLLLLLCSSMIWGVLYTVSVVLIWFVSELKQVAYIVLHIGSVVLTVIIAEPLTDWFISFNSAELLQFEFWLKLASAFLLWTTIQCFIRIFVFPFIRGCLENNKSKVCLIITLIGIIAIFAANKIFDFSSIAVELDLTSENIAPIILQSIIAFTFLVLMSYINAWIRFPDESADLHREAAMLFLIICTLGIAIAAGAASSSSSSSRAKYKDSDGNKYDEYKNRIY